MFVRVDFNVPLEGGRVTDDTRIAETLPTLKLARERGARLVLASHLGRPKGKPDPKYSLRPVAAKLAELAGAPVDFAAGLRGRGGRSEKPRARGWRHPAARERSLSRGGRGQRRRLFRASLPRSAMGCSYATRLARRTARMLPWWASREFVRQAAAGLLMERELAYLGKALTNPERPFVAVLGGAKVSDKIEVVENLMKVADAMLIGGGMAYTFLKSQGLAVGKSLVEADKLDLARRVLEDASANEFPAAVAHRSRGRRGIQGRHANAHDAGRRHARRLDGARHRAGDDPHGLPRRSRGAKTIVWNGPMGVFEMPAFARGTLEMAQAVAAATARGATSIVGGGDSVAAVHQAGVAGQDFAHLDGRRRVARVSGGQEAARRRSAYGQG